MSFTQIVCFPFFIGYISLVMRNHFRSLFTQLSALILLAALVGIPASKAQQADQKGMGNAVFDSMRFARAQNSAISVIVEKSRGQFWIETTKGERLLFAGKSYLTSFTNLRFDGTTFTNNNLQNPQTPRGTERMAFGDAMALSDRVRFQTTVVHFGRTMVLTQDFIPSLENDYAFIRIETSIENLTSVNVTTGVQLMFDVYLGQSDLIDVKVDGSAIHRESQWRDSKVPDMWSGSSLTYPIELRGRLRGSTITPPDQFVIGRWQYNGYLGAAAWNYQPSGLTFTDNAVLLQWNEATLRPREKRTVSTDYGYIGSLETELFCSADDVQLSADGKSYVPHPFTVSATVRNTGTVQLPPMDVAIQLPLRTSLAPGESLVKSIGPIPIGGDSILQWQVYSELRDTTSLLSFPIQIVRPFALQATCTASVTLPAVHRYAVSLTCPDTIHLTLSPDGYSYDPDTLNVTANIQNSGNVPLTVLVASIVLPDELLLDGTPPFQNVSPLPLTPGLHGIAVWKLRAKSQRKETFVAYTIKIIGENGVNDSCKGIIHLPAIHEQPPCVDNGTTTKGKEFWTAFPLNDRGESPEQLCLFISATRESRVRISRPTLGLADDLIVPSGTTATFIVEPTMDDQIADTVTQLGIHIASDEPIAVYSANLRHLHSDGSIVLPVHALGKKYVTVGYNNEMPEEYFLIAATENGTTVEINPFSQSSTLRPGRVPYTILMNQGETYMLKARLLGLFGGLSGSFIDADKPVAVISGAHTGWIPTNTFSVYGFLNPHYEQVIPIEHLGSEYITVPFASRKRGDTFEAIAAYDSTTVTVDGRTPVLLVLKGDAQEFLLESAASVKGDRPFLLAQFANSAAWDDSLNQHGDGSMVIHSPLDRSTNCHSFPVGIGNRFDTSFVNIVVPTDANSSVTLNGRVLSDTAFRAVGSTGYSVAQLPLRRGMYRVETKDQRGISAIVYGFEYHDAVTFNSGYLVTRTSPLTEVEHLDRSGFELLLPTPNPASESFLVKYRLSEPSNVQLNLYDMLGRRMKSMVNGALPSGEHHLAVHVRELPNGLYILRMAYERGTLIQKVIIKR